MNALILEETPSDPFSFKGSFQSPSSLKAFKNFSLEKNDDLQSNLLGRTNYSTKQEPKILLDSRQAYKTNFHSPNKAFDSDSKSSPRKTIFKDAAKGILIRKTGTLKLRTDSNDASPFSPVRSPDFASPFQGESDTVVTNSIMKKTENFFSKIVDTETDDIKSPTSILGLRRARKVTFLNEVERNKEDNLDSLPLKSSKSTPLSNTLKSNKIPSINSIEKSPSVSKREQENLNRGPRLISEALVSGASDDLLFKEGKSSGQEFAERVANINKNFIEFEKEFTFKQEEIENDRRFPSLKLPSIASARSSKAFIYDLSPQIKTERTELEKFPKKPVEFGSLAENNVNRVSSARQSYKGHLRKTASFTVGRNKTKDFMGPLTKV